MWQHFLKFFGGLFFLMRGKGLIADYSTLFQNQSIVESISIGLLNNSNLVTNLSKY